jgi:small-conductance mechanosensitive channel
MRRSEQMSETFPFEVDYTTTFEQLEELRNKMLVFLKAERRDYLPSFDVVVVGMCSVRYMFDKLDFTSFQIFPTSNLCR